MADEKKKQVLEYIKKYRSLGYSDEQIKKALLKSGIDEKLASHLLGRKKWEERALLAFLVVALLIGAYYLVFVVPGLLEEVFEGAEEEVEGEEVIAEGGEEGEVTVEEEVECLTDNDCEDLYGSGFSCLDDGFCHEVSGGGATGGGGETTTTTAECSSDSDCATGEVCSSDSACEAVVACTSDEDCSEGSVCSSESTCTESVECTSDADCSSGNVCSADGVCEEEGVECTSDADCSSGNVCSSDGACVESVECTSDDDCSDGEVCSDGACVAEEVSVACTTDTDCDTDVGEICSADGTCEVEGVIRGIFGECSNDDDCDTDAGEVCSDDGTCEIEEICDNYLDDDGDALFDDTGGCDVDADDEIDYICGCYSEVNGFTQSGFYKEITCSLDEGYYCYELSTDSYIHQTCGVGEDIEGTYYDPDTVCESAPVVEEELVCTDALPTCADGVDNDDDGNTDRFDPDCTSWDADEGEVEEAEEEPLSCTTHADCNTGEACSSDGICVACVDSDAENLDIGSTQFKTQGTTRGVMYDTGTLGVETNIDSCAVDDIKEYYCEGVVVDGEVHNFSRYGFYNASAACGDGYVCENGACKLELVTARTLQRELIAEPFGIGMEAETGTPCIFDVECEEWEACSSDGFCVACEDSDAGGSLELGDAQFRIQGTVTGVSYDTRDVETNTDTCTTNTEIKEYICGGRLTDNNEMHNFSSYGLFSTTAYCGDNFVCENGACKLEFVTVSPFIERLVLDTLETTCTAHADCSGGYRCDLTNSVCYESCTADTQCKVVVGYSCDTKTSECALTAGIGSPGPLKAAEIEGSFWQKLWSWLTKA